MSERQDRTQLSVADQELLAAAETARETAYARYSGFQVGAALRCTDGRVFVGCNIENASYGLTICAERVAVFSAVAAGAHSFRAVAVVAGQPGAAPATPCGACRQVLAEFGPSFRVLLAAPGAGEPVLVTSVNDLLPGAFSLESGGE
ncbi:MAG TPA: cytidine deaminase [Chloroflexia bacterium]|nr:cytidine deaminase [Chloroflexia bacterium]